MTHGEVIVTDDFSSFAAHLVHLGLPWAYRVRYGAAEVIGAAHTKGAAKKAAQAALARFKYLTGGKPMVSYGRPQRYVEASGE